MHHLEGLNGTRPYLKYLLDMLGHKVGDFITPKSILAMDLKFGPKSFSHQAFNGSFGFKRVCPVYSEYPVRTRLTTPMVVNLRGFLYAQCSSGVPPPRTYPKLTWST